MTAAGRRRHDTTNSCRSNYNAADNCDRRQACCPSTHTSDCRARCASTRGSATGAYGCRRCRRYRLRKGKRRNQHGGQEARGQNVFDMHVCSRLNVRHRLEIRVFKDEKYQKQKVPSIRMLCPTSQKNDKLVSPLKIGVVA